MVIATTLYVWAGQVGPLAWTIAVVGLLITVWLARRATHPTPPGNGHDALVVQVGEHDHALICQCGAVFPVRRGQSPDECPEWHAHATTAHLRQMSEARRG